jgi:hypothetical protein
MATVQIEYTVMVSVEIAGGGTLEGIHAGTTEQTEGKRMEYKGM